MKKNIYLTWDAFKHGFEVTINALEMLHQQKNIKIDDIIYLMNRNLKPETQEAIKVFEKSHHYEFHKPKFTQKRLKIKNPTDYQAIYNEIRKFLKELDNKNVHLHINTSPGTPQMHAVWLMLNSSGYLPAATTLWSTQRNEQGQTTLDEITFKPYTYLHEIFDTSFNHQNPNEVPINPNNTLSNQRKSVEKKINLFAAIPQIPILILGERGVGKTNYVRELIAKEYYPKKPFHPLSCGTFTDELMRSELFGYVKGAFTGANIDKKGILAQFKEGGLLFLDEIQDLSKPLQRQLMQALQDKEYYPIGSDKSERTDFRLITASNLSLEALISEAKLDLDFFDRIATYIVAVPPIRESKEDLQRFWEETWQKYTNSSKPFWNDTLAQFLENQELKGNFRDLQKIALYIWAFYQETKDEESAIDKGIAEFLKWIPKTPQRQNAFSYFKEGKTYKDMVQHFNYDLVDWAVKTYGSRKKAAEILERSEASISLDLKYKPITGQLK